MVKGVAQFTKRLTKDIPALVQAAARDAMEKGAEDVVAMMKRLAPVESGALRDSISWIWGDAPAGSFIIGTVGGREYKTMRITIYAGGLADEDVFYARFLEFGTQKMRAHPFFYPAWRAKRRSVKNRISRTISKALKAEGGQ